LKKVPITAIIFDLDGTLMYYDKGIIEFLDKIVINTLEDMGFPVPNKDERVRLWRGKKSSNDVLRDWGIKDLGKFWKIFDDYQLPTIEKGIKTGEVKLYDDVIPVLDKLKNNGFVIGMMTNTPPEITKAKLKHLGIREYFSCVIAMGTERQEYAKPHPYGINECMQKLGVDKNDTAHVGDELFDILAAKNAGCHSVLIDREGIKSFEESPDFKIKSLYELFDIFTLKSK